MYMYFSTLNQFNYKCCRSMLDVNVYFLNDIKQFIDIFLLYVLLT